MEGFTPAEERLREIAKREEYAARLAALFQLLIKHPKIPVPRRIEGDDININLFGAGSREALRATMRAFKPCTWDKRPWEGESGRSYLEMKGSWNGWNIELNLYRDVVCKRVVKGSREVTEQVQDPDALAAVPMITVTRTEEIVEWECEPVTKVAPAGELVPA